MTERIKAKDYRGGLFAGGKKGPQPVEPKERNISNAIEDFLNARGIYNDRLNAGLFQQVTSYVDRTGKEKEYRRWIRLCRKGTPDRFAIIPPNLDPLKRGGYILFIEVKRRGEKPKPEQVEIHRQLRDAGAMVFVADSIDGFIRKWTAVFEQ